MKLSNEANIENSNNNFEVKLDELKDPSQDKFLFCIVPDKVDTECIAGLSLKNGVRILSGILLYEALYSLAQSWDTKYTSKFIFRLILGLCYLCTACCVCYITFYENVSYTNISLVVVEILFILEFLYYLLKSFLRIFEFINPWDGDFLNLKNILYIVGDLAYLFVFLYFIYVLYCYLVSLKR